MFRRTILMVALALALAALALAGHAAGTDITVSSFSTQSGGYHWGGTTATVRIYSNQSWTDSNGVTHIAGVAGSQTGWFQSINCTVTNNTLSIPTFTIASTIDAIQNKTVLLTAVIFDSNNRAHEHLFDNWRIPNQPTPTTWQALVVYNAGQPRPLGDTYATLAQVNALITGALGSGSTPVMTDAIQGKGRLLVPASNPADPIVVGPNGPTFSGTATFGGDMSIAGYIGVNIVAGGARLKIIESNNTVQSTIQVVNTSNGNVAQAGFQATNDTPKSVGMGVRGSGNAAYGSLVANDAYLVTGGADLAIMADAPTGVIKFASGGNTEVGRFNAAGALLATITDKGGQVFNAKAYGAIGNGVANDTTAINNAIIAANAAGGGIVFLPVGTYLCTAVIRPLAKVYIVGAGMGATTIKRGAALTTTLITPASAINYWGVSNLTIDGNLGTTTNTGSAEVQDTATSTYLLIDRVQFTKFATIGIYVLGSHVDVGRSVFDGAAATVTTNAQYGVHCSTATASDVTIDDNKFLHLRGPGAWMSGTNIRFTHNYLEDNQYAQNPGGGQVGVTNEFANLPINVLIDGNVFGPVTNAIGVYAGELNGSCAFTNNQINGQQNAGIKVQTGGSGSAYDGANVRISGNTIKNTVGAAIVLNPGTHDVIIEGNNAYDTQTPMTQTYGLHIASTCFNVQYRNNNFLTNLSGGVLNDASAVVSVRGDGNFPTIDNTPLRLDLNHLVGTDLGNNLRTHKIGPVANNGVTSFQPWAGGDLAIIDIIDSDGNMARYFCRGGASATVELQDSGSVYTITKDNAGTTNIYYLAGYQLQNKSGHSITYYITAISFT